MSENKTGEILVTNLVKKFGDFLAVNKITMSIPRGVIFAFLGPNGAGKTTTIKMLTTLLEPTEGSVFINGINVVENPEDARRAFGIIFQDPSLDDELTAYENLELHGVLYGVPKELRRQRIHELMKIIDLWERKDDLVKDYSGGMRRRLEIARGLIHHPAIIFLDEPTLGLDPQTRNHIWEYIKNLNQTEKITVFFTTHYMEEADRMAQNIAIIDHGSIIDKGTPQDLKAKTGKENLEDAFIALTGSAIREEQASGVEHFRRMRGIWTGKKR